MEHPALTLTTTLAELLEQQPKAAAVLLDLRVDCVGCSMKRFCTLEDMCQDYGLKAEVVMERLRRVEENPLSTQCRK